MRVPAGRGEAVGENHARQKGGREVLRDDRQASTTDQQLVSGP